MHYPLAQHVNSQRTGSISQILAERIVEEVENDGANFIQTKEIDPESQLPGGFNQDIIIRLTDADFDITQMNKTFLSLTLTSRLHFSDTVFDAALTGAAANAQKGMFLFVGLKNSSDVIHDYQIIHKGLTVANSLQNDATIESFLYHVVEDKVTKNNMKHVYSLYNSVHNFDQSICGRYISFQELSTLPASQMYLNIDIPITIPITSILPFQAFREYPNGLFGELKIKFKINPRAFVFCLVDPKKSVLKHFYETNELSVANYSALEELMRDSRKFNDYTHGFTQFGLASTIGNIGNDGTWSPKQLTITMDSYSLPRISCAIRGFKMDPSALEQERQRYQSTPWVVPSQRCDISAFPQAISQTALKTSQNIALHYVTDFIIMFPKYPQQITCFENPMLQNLQLNTMGRNLPERPLNTTEHSFFLQMMQASDLDDFGLEATDEYENSLATPRATATRRLQPSTDLSSFIVTLPVERDSGAGLYFDGLDTKGQNVSVEVRGNQIFQGANDTYYNVDGLGTTPPPPILGMIQDTFWIFSSRSGGKCTYETDKEFNEAVRSFVSR